MPHGVAIAHGNLVALILSNMLLGLDSAEVSAYAAWLRANYPDSGITCKDYPRLWEIAVHDKKNAGGRCCVIRSWPRSGRRIMMSR